MRALVQRVLSAAVVVDEETVGSIGAGLCAFVGVTHGDGESSADSLAKKIWQLRIFEDAEGRTNLSAAELHLPVLVVSQFTLYADVSRGRRPSFVAAAPPDRAAALVERVMTTLETMGAHVSSGRFGARMMVKLVNDGPFTLMLET